MYNGASSRSGTNPVSEPQLELAPSIPQSREPQSGPQIALPPPSANTSPELTKGPMVNPVANKLQDALNNQQLSTEEALQMMNDFVSGNQDMSKSITNINGMLDQVAQSRHTAPNSPGIQNQEVNPSSTVTTNNPKTDDARHLYQTEMAFSNNQNDRVLPQPEPFHVPSNSQYQPEYSNEYSEPPVREYRHGDYSQGSYQRESPSDMAFSASLQKEQHLPPGLPSMSDTDISRSNEMSPNEPPPPVHVYDRVNYANHDSHPFVSPSSLPSQYFNSIDAQERNSYHPSQQLSSENLGNLIFPPSHSQEVASRSSPNSLPSGNLLVDPVITSPLMSDGYSNPSFRKHVPTIQNVPPGSLLDRIDPHEMMPDGGINRNSDAIFKAGTMQASLGPNIGHSDSALTPNMPTVDNLAESATITHENSHVTYGGNNLYSYGNQGYSDFNIPDSKFPASYETEAQEPVGHLGPVMQDSGSDQYAARKFRIQSREKATPNIINHKIQLAVKGLSKSQQGAKKHKSLSAIYTDSIFPEDFADIESLKGSLQGKTLTNFDGKDSNTLKLHAVTGSRKSVVQELDVKASFPVEANANDEGGRDNGRVILIFQLTMNLYNLHLNFIRFHTYYYQDPENHHNM